MEYISTAQQRDLDTLHCILPTCPSVGHNWLNRADTSTSGRLRKKPPPSKSFKSPPSCEQARPQNKPPPNPGYIRIQALVLAILPVLFVYIAMYSLCVLLVYTSLVPSKLALNLTCTEDNPPLLRLLDPACLCQPHEIHRHARGPGRPQPLNRNAMRQQRDRDASVGAHAGGELVKDDTKSVNVTALADMPGGEQLQREGRVCVFVEAAAKRCIKVHTCVMGSMKGPPTQIKNVQRRWQLTYYAGRHQTHNSEAVMQDTSVQLKPIKHRTSGAMCVGVCRVEKKGTRKQAKRQQ
jgi:hypothetical protein